MGLSCNNSFTLPQSKMSLIEQNKTCCFNNWSMVKDSGLGVIRGHLLQYMVVTKKKYWVQIVFMLLLSILKNREWFSIYKATKLDWVFQKDWPVPDRLPLTLKNISAFLTMCQWSISACSLSMVMQLLLIMFCWGEELLIGGCVCSWACAHTLNLLFKAVY